MNAQRRRDALAAEFKWRFNRSGRGLAGKPKESDGAVLRFAEV